jgi:hypothetical protein
MNSAVLVPPVSISHELTFLKQQTGQTETTILAQALQLGLNLLYRQTIEQLWIDGLIKRAEALAVLGEVRLLEVEYAKKALLDDIQWGLAT